VSRRIARKCARAAALASALAAVAGPGVAAVPPGFTDSLVADVSMPTALAFTPDGRMLITTQSGRLRVYASGSLLATPALDLSGRICSNSERGLLGVAVDPSFGVGTNRDVYLYYTASLGGTCVNRVSRFHLADTNLVAPTSEAILVDQIPSPAGNHNGGDLNFGKDGNLYVSIGDGGCDYKDTSRCAGSNTAARDQFILLGKVLRITRDGGIPPDNPFLGADSGRCNVTGRTAAAKCQETFAWGLRNPFRFAFDPNAPVTRFFINDVGQSTWEEIDLGQAGADYGWNVREGFCALGSTTNCGTPPAGMTNPIFAYGHATGCRALTGGAFVPNGVWPAEYDGDYLYGDFVCGKVVRLEPSGGGWAATDFATGLGPSSAVHMRFGPWTGPFGPTQALYYTTYASSGEVRRIGYTAGPPPAPPPSPPPAPPPAPPATPPSPPAVRIAAIRYDAPGVDRRTARSLNGEWVRLRNLGSRAVALTGWTIRDADRHAYRFRRYVLGADSSVTVHTGPGRSSAAHRYWGRAAHVWGNARDRATLRAVGGAVVDGCRYANRRADLKRC
jgi:glucose/arabinose dehydrogenase